METINLKMKNKMRMGMMKKNYYEQLINKELLDLVLGKDVTYFEPSLDSLYYEYVTYRTERNQTSIAQLVERCEEFIMEKEFTISTHSNENKTWNLCLIPFGTNIHHVIGRRIKEQDDGIGDLKNWKTSFRDRNELMLLACRWVIDEEILR